MHKRGDIALLSEIIMNCYIMAS